MSLRSRPLALAALAAVLALSACSDGVTPPSRTGHVAALNAVNGTTAIDLLYDGQLVNGFAGIPFGQPAGALVDLAPGAHDLAARPSGTTESLFLMPIDIGASSHYVLVVHGRRGSIMFAPTLTRLVYGAPPPRGQGSLRVFDTAPEPSGVDLYVTLPNEDIALLTPTAQQVGYNVALPPIVFPAGTVRIRVTWYGTKTVLADATVPLPSGREVIAAVTGDLRQDPSPSTPLAISVMPAP